jgi:hypothetical protein
MPDVRRLSFFCEGHDDYEVVEWLVGRRHVPDGLESRRVCRPVEAHAGAGGKDGMMEEAAALLGAPIPAIIVRDWDDEDAEHVQVWFERSAGAKVRVARRARPAGSPAGFFPFQATARSGSGRTAPVAVVVVGDRSVTNLPACADVTRFAMDDSLVRLVARPDVYGAISELDRVPHATTFAKLSSFAQALKQNGLPLATCKRVLELLRGITGFRASPAEFARRVLDCAGKVVPEDELLVILDPLISPLRFAADWLLTAEGSGGTGS